MPVALITGITGQDGSYLTELLLEKGYTVHGIVRRASSFNRSRIEHLRGDSTIEGQRLFLHYADLTDATTLRRLILRIQPDELYHLAGQSHVGLSFEIPESTCQETAMATLALLEICRDLPKPPRFFHAASSEVFGNPDSSPQTEDTPFRPASPYGCAKAFAANLGAVYRQAHGLFVCCGIAYNHESPRRGENFVTRKITSAAVRMANGSNEVLELGNLDSVRDWGWAPDYVTAMWLMLQHAKPDDYVLATGTATSVRDFANAAFEEVGITIEFTGQGVDEIGQRKGSGGSLVRVNPRFFRAADPVGLVGNPDRAKSHLSWRPGISGPDVARAMVRAERTA